MGSTADSTRRPRHGPLLVALVVTVLASLFAVTLVRPMGGGDAHVPWYVGMALLAGIGVASLLLAARGTTSKAPAALVLPASVGATALAAVHLLFGESTAFAALTILIAALGVVCVVLAVRWQRTSARS